jgi:hypothetical protein
MLSLATDSAARNSRSAFAMRHAAALAAHMEKPTQRVGFSALQICCYMASRKLGNNIAECSWKSIVSRASILL